MFLKNKKFRFGSGGLLLPVIIAAMLAFGCKPRLGSRLYSSDSAGSNDEHTATKIAITRGYGHQSGLHGNNHNAYELIFNDLQANQVRTDDAGYGVWIDALIFFTEELHKRYSDETTYEAIDPTISDIVVGSKILSFTDVLEAYGQRSHQGRQICWTQVTCRSAITGLSALAEVSSSLSDMQWRKFQTLWTTLDKSVKSLSASTADQILEFRLATLKAKALFFRSVRLKEGFRPMWQTVTQNGEPIQDTDFQNLTNLLRNNISDAEAMYLRSDDPQRINPRTKYELISDIALSDVYSVSEDMNGVQVNAQRRQPCGSQQDCEQLLRAFSEDDREFIQQDIDLIADELIADHVFNRAALHYLDRVMSGVNDIRPWLDQLERKARSWTDWVGGQMQKGPAAKRPAELEHISPTLGLLMLTMFSRYELWLPFRHEFRDSAKRLARRTVVHSDFGQDQTLQAGALQIAKAIAVQVDYVDKHLKQLSEQFDYGDLSMREKNAALLFPRDFHSFQSQALKVSAARQRFVEMATKEQERVNANKQVQGLSPGFENALFQRIVADVEMACTNLASGVSRSKFYETGMEEQSTNGCWQVYFRGAGVNFELSQGLTGKLALGPLCQFPTDGNGRISKYPLSLRNISTKLRQIDANGNMTRVCAQESAQLNVQIASQAVGVALMPVMGGLSHVALARLGQLAASQALKGVASKAAGAASTRFLATEIGKKLAASALGRFTASSAGKVGTVGMQSFLSAAMFHFGTMAMLSPMGMAQAWDPEQNVATNLRIHAESIATMTLTFMLMRPVHGIAAKAAVPVAGSVPAQLGRFAVPPMARTLAQQSAVRGIPFMATTLYFTEAHRLHAAVSAASDTIFGEMERMPHGEETYFQRFMHSAAMTLGFTLYGSLQSRWKQQPEEADYLLAKARQWRNQRLAPWSSEFPSQFNVFRTPEGGVRVLQTPEMVQTGSPAINPYKLFGIRMRPPSRRWAWQKNGPQWNARVNQRYERYVEKMQRAVKDAKDPESKEIYQQFLDRAGLFKEVLTNPKLREHYDSQLYNEAPYQQFYETNTNQARLQ